MRPRFQVIDVVPLAPDINRVILAAPSVARYARPGQFVIVRLDESGERVPLTICEYDPSAGTITLVIQAVGHTTRLLTRLQPGDDVSDVLGPLGRPSAIARYGRTVVVGGGVGTAIALPVARALAQADNTVTGIVGARDGAHLILIDEMSAACDDLAVVTEDGSTGRSGLVTGPLVELLASERTDLVFAAGPVAMMAAVADVTRPYGVDTIASLNPIMVDGTGMCGGCRVRVGGETRFACVDGPEFDAHQVDFDLLAVRNQAYVEFERCRVGTETVS
jgi:ferredoxin/flavodoxin---NADP+ reductase